jgi:Domain of unknown function (DUF4277)
MKTPLEAINIVNLDHLGIVAGIMDEMELLEEVNKKVGIRTRETVSPGQVMKAMILNGPLVFERPNIQSISLIYLI